MAVKICDSGRGEAGNPLAERRPTPHSGWAQEQPTAPRGFVNTVDGCTNEKLGWQWEKEQFSTPPGQRKVVITGANESWL